MDIILKLILLFGAELTVCYVTGFAVSKIVFKKNMGISFQLVSGFIICQALFQVIALPFVMKTGILHVLSRCWIIVISSLVLIAVIWNRKEMQEQWKNVFHTITGNKTISVLLMICILALCYYVSVNGQINDDSRYYIGLVNTTVSTDTLYRYNVYNGFEINSIYTRRALATFEIHSAVLCQIFHLHALVLARIFRASENVIMTAAVIYEIGKKLFPKAEAQLYRKAGSLVILSFLLEFVMANTIYSSATFFLHRTYEGKAFTASVMVLFTLYLCLVMVLERNVRYLVMFIMAIWGGMAVSATAMIILPVEAGVLLLASGATLLYKKRREKLHAGN